MQKKDKLFLLNKTHPCNSLHYLKINNKILKLFLSSEWNHLDPEHTAKNNPVLLFSFLSPPPPALIRARLQFLFSPVSLREEPVALVLLWQQGGGGSLRSEQEHLKLSWWEKRGCQWIVMLLLDILLPLLPPARHRRDKLSPDTCC